MMPCYRNNFHVLFMQSWDLLPDMETKRLFVTAVAGAMSVHLDQATIERCIELALGTSQNFAPRLELVKR